MVLISTSVACIRKGATFLLQSQIPQAISKLRSTTAEDTRHRKVAGLILISGILLSMQETNGATWSQTKTSISPSAPRPSWSMIKSLESTSFNWLVLGLTLRCPNVLWEAKSHVTKTSATLIQAQSRPPKSKSLAVNISWNSLTSLAAQLQSQHHSLWSYKNLMLVLVRTILW